MGKISANRWPAREKAIKRFAKKNTKDWLMQVGEELNIFKGSKARAFLFENLNKKRNKFHTCSKIELIHVFLESGVDLAGKLPDGILK